VNFGTKDSRKKRMKEKNIRKENKKTTTSTPQRPPPLHKQHNVCIHALGDN
jgi:hypothetical protein